VYPGSSKSCATPGNDLTNIHNQFSCFSWAAFDLKTI
jgi:hypothetical protein